MQGMGSSDGEDRVCGFLRRRYDREEKAEFVADGVTVWFTRPHNGIAADLAQVQFVGWGVVCKDLTDALFDRTLEASDVQIRVLDQEWVASEAKGDRSVAQKPRRLEFHRVARGSAKHTSFNSHPPWADRNEAGIPRVEFS